MRSEEDRARDTGRKPAELIAAVGIEPGMNILEIIAGGGWYTEVLAIAVGPEGHITAHNTPGALQLRDGANEVAISARLAGGRYPNVSRLNKNTHEIVAADGKFDAAFTALNLHDIYNSGGEDGAIASLAAVFTVLKPGGFFVIIDHDGLAENNNAALHRIAKDDAIRIAVAAGFELELESDVLQNDDDDMSMHTRDKSVYGRTNRFVLKFRKPA
jgi:predicted methyltransferase